MNARSLRADAQFDLEQLLGILQEMTDDEADHHRVFCARVAHINRIRTQVSEALRSAQRIDDDPERAWDPRSVAA